jgi:hypothetical protein
MTILQRFNGDPPRIARESEMIAVRDIYGRSDAERRPVNFGSLAGGAR